MTKTELAGELARVAEVSKAKAGDIVDALFANDGIIVKALKKRDKVAIPGFGTFESKARAAREARNPATGVIVKVAAKNAPHFSAGKGLKDALN